MANSLCWLLATYDIDWKPKRDHHPYILINWCTNEPFQLSCHHRYCSKLILCAMQSLHSHTYPRSGNLRFTLHFRHILLEMPEISEIITVGIHNYYAGYAERLPEMAEKSQITITYLKRKLGRTYTLSSVMPSGQNKYRTSPFFIFRWPLV